MTACLYEWAYVATYMYTLLDPRFRKISSLLENGKCSYGVVYSESRLTKKLSMSMASYQK